GLVEKLAVGDELEQHDARLGSQVADLLRLVLVDPVDGRQRAEQLAIDACEEARPDEDEDSRGGDAHDERQHGRVPEREARPDAQLQAHSRAAPRTNPMPRTVCRSFLSKGSSILRRSRAIVTSMTLSRGVARAATCHTELASMSRETVRPGWRSRHSRTSNSLPVSSSERSPLSTSRVPTFTRS